MLVLGRKLNEVILIGDNISIRVVGIQLGKVCLGIEAPGLRILREELLPQQEHNQPAKEPSNER